MTDRKQGQDPVDDPRTGRPMPRDARVRRDASAPAEFEVDDQERQPSDAEAEVAEEVADAEDHVDEREAEQAELPHREAAAPKGSIRDQLKDEVTGEAVSAPAMLPAKED